MQNINYLDFTLDFLSLDEQYTLMELDYAMEKAIDLAISKILSPKKRARRSLFAPFENPRDLDEPYLDLGHDPDELY